MKAEKKSEMENLFIPYELAKLAKEKGYWGYGFGQWVCRETWNMKLKIFEMKYVLDRFGRNKSLYYKADECAAPVYQQIIDWFREKHTVVIWISFNQDSCKYEYQGLSNISKNPWFTDCGFVSYHEAIDKAIEEALKLI